MIETQAGTTINNLENAEMTDHVKVLSESPNDESRDASRNVSKNALKDASKDVSGNMDKSMISLANESQTERSQQSSNQQQANQVINDQPNSTLILSKQVKSGQLFGVYILFLFY